MRKKRVSWAWKWGKKNICHECGPHPDHSTSGSPLTLWAITIVLPWWLSGKESTYQSRRHGFDPWVGNMPWRRKWQPIPVFLSGKSHGQRSWVGYSPAGCKKLDTTERLNSNITIRLQNILACLPPTPYFVKLTISSAVVTPPRVHLHSVLAFQILLKVQDKWFV